MNLKKFRKTIWSYYGAHGRKFPWRPPCLPRQSEHEGRVLKLPQDSQNADPYKILVSEIMLQQTQTDRVVPKYEKFIKAFPNFQTLSRAPFKKVFQRWQGLGYNRRAMALKRTAEIVTREYGGTLPRSVETLEKLPGIGPYTARAILAFAWDESEVFIETNIRTVFIHFFFKKKRGVRDKQILKLVERTLDRKHPREWYFALMDYGAWLKKTLPNPSRRSARHAQQSKFEGSDRQIRGAIMRVLGAKDLKKSMLLKTLPFPALRVKQNLRALVREKLVTKREKRYSL